MNAPNPTPSPLVPQGSIPPKNTSRSSRVLLIALTVVFLHVAGLGVVLMQGCQKDANTAGSNSATNGLSYAPMDAATNAMFAAAPTSTPAAPVNPIVAPASNIVAYTPPTPTVAAATGLQEPPISAPTGEPGATTEYKVVSGDNLDKIARKNKISLSALNAANPGLDPRKLQVGKTVKIPSRPATAAPIASANTGAPAVAGGEVSGGYKVKAGDNLTKIARANGVTVGQLRAANNLKTSNVKAGQVLKIPARATATNTTSPTHH
jgi:LysM repeat protein